MILDRFLLSMLRKAMGFRGDGNPFLKYFREKEFGISSTPFSFYSGKNLLRGKRFYVEGDFPRAVVIFFHGLGAGYNAYMQEIAAIAKRGYLVYAYDNTGCMTSEGQGIGCLAQSLLDQQAFFTFLDSEKQAEGLPRYAVGHSWGGYTALGALDPRYGVEKVVSISGFISLTRTLMSQEKALAKMEHSLRKALRLGYGEFGALEMADLVFKTSARVLYIQGENDPMVPKPGNYDVLESLCKGKPNVRLMLVKGAMHNPYWTLDAQKYLYELGNKQHAFGLNFDNSLEIDYQRLNQDDPKVMGEIFGFLAE
ncbi:MAG: lysophospholipase [Bacilli bacterium]|nr:lysophospholipase [Bacilli bacterium]